MRELLKPYTETFDTGEELDAYVRVIEKSPGLVRYYFNVTEDNKLQLTVEMEA